jgi:hypothetical protein
MMEKITLRIGTVQAVSSGQVDDHTKPVEFVGELVYSRTTHGLNSRGTGLSDTRGVTESLYQTEDDRYVVSVEDWSRWQGEPTTRTLHLVEEDDLGVGGRFEALGRDAGLGRPLTIDEATS